MLWVELKLTLTSNWLSRYWRTLNQLVFLFNLMIVSRVIYMKFCVNVMPFLLYHPMLNLRPWLILEALYNNICKAFLWINLRLVCPTISYKIHHPLLSTGKTFHFDNFQIYRNIEHNSYTSADISFKPKSELSHPTPKHN